jgi:ribose transport system permease protein
VFRVHPLIMTLAMSLVVLGLANAFQLAVVKTSSGVPDPIRSIGADTIAGVLPYSLVVFVPIAVLIILGLRRSGYGRMLFAIGDNPIAARLSGGRAWQVLIVLYIVSAVIAAVAGILISGFTNVASVTLADVYVLPSVAAAVIGGTSILGGSWRVRRDDHRGTDPDRGHGAAREPRVPGSGPPDPLRVDHRRGGGGLHPGHRRGLT